MTRGVSSNKAPQAAIHAQTDRYNLRRTHIVYLPIYSEEPQVSTRAPISTADPQPAPEHVTSQTGHAVVEWVPILKYREHDPMELVQAALAYIRRSEASQIQVQALARFCEWSDKWKGPSAGEGPIRDLLPILSNLFFWGRLHTIRFKWVKTLCRRHGAYGMTSDVYKRHGIKEPGVVLIKMDPAARFESEVENREAWLSTLLHECVHAFLDLYSCEEDGDGCEIARGTSGHGCAFLHLATDVEAVARLLLKMDVNLTIHHSIINTESTPEYTPTLLDWQSIWTRQTVHNIFDLTMKHSEVRRSSMIELMELSAKRDPAMAAWWKSTVLPMMDGAKASIGCRVDGGAASEQDKTLLDFMQSRFGIQS